MKYTIAYWHIEKVGDVEVHVPIPADPLVPMPTRQDIEGFVEAIKIDTGKCPYS